MILEYSVFETQELKAKFKIYKDEIDNFHVNVFKLMYQKYQDYLTRRNNASKIMQYLNKEMCFKDFANCLVSDWGYYIVNGETAMRLLFGYVSIWYTENPKNRVERFFNYRVFDYSSRKIKRVGLSKYIPFTKLWKIKIDDTMIKMFSTMRIIQELYSYSLVSDMLAMPDNHSVFLESSDFKKINTIENEVINKVREFNLLIKGIK